MKYLKSCLAVLFLLGASAAWGAPDRGQELFGVFLRNLAPEKAYFQLSSAPRENAPGAILNASTPTYAACASVR